MTGRAFYYDPINSHAATHFNDAPRLKGIAVDVLSRRNVRTNPLEFDIDMKMSIGNKDVVDVDEYDEIVYAKRKNRDEYVLFVKNRYPQPCPYVSISLRAHGHDSYLLPSTWIGEFESPPFPGESSATSESAAFWNRHAFVWGGQGIQDGSETAVRPW